MYAIDWTSLFLRSRAAVAQPDGSTAPAGEAVAGRRRLPAVSPTVWALGFTSLLTDVSSEMVASILPMYLVLQLGMQPFAFGVIDGMYQGAAALVRIAGGVLADRWQRHKEVAATGYALSAVCRVALLAAGTTWTAIAGIVAVDRIGKGIRTAPRDALIALRTPKANLASAFGVHRGLDAAGAMLGPFVAFALLALMPGRFDVLFALSFVIAICGVAIILLFVPPVTEPTASSRPVTVASATDVLHAPPFRAILGAGFVLALPTVSDAFIFLTLQQQLNAGASVFPLFYVATSLFTAMFAVPFGRLADKAGRKPVLLGGYALLACVYGVLLMPAGPWWTVVLPIALLGAYYAATDGVLTAIAAAVIAPGSSGGGLSFLATATNIGKVLASVTFGLLWARAGLGVAIGWYLAALLIAMVAAAVLLPAGRETERQR
jgi:MFS family permease